MIRPTWTLTVAPAWAAAVGDAERVRDLLQHPGSLVHENDRGFVYATMFAGALLVLKRSKIQERRRWIQLTSLYRGGEGARAFGNLVRLHEAGLPVPEPVFAIEQTRAGFVIASWHAYRYVDGVPCSCADAEAIAKTLRVVHDHGWVHRDPHVRNFLNDGSRLSIIDWARARPWRFAYAQRYDVVLLDKCCPGACLQYPGLSASDPLYRLARHHNNWVVRWRRVKRYVRAAAGVRRALDRD
ncbi:MAG: phosphotransferase [Vicinamibacterales bacterium]|nr:phosphotransferase [Vicinamibacterales bacterium]